MESFTLSTNLINAIMQYLGSQPYVQVSQLISAIQKEVQDQQKPEQPIE